MDMILNGQAHGSVASVLLNNGFDMRALRPFVGDGDDRNSYITQNVDGKAKSVLLRNATATLRRDEWKQFDDAVLMAARQRLRILSDLRGAGLVYNIPNGMGKTVLESQVMGDITGATVSMDPARKSEGDRPEFDIVNLPLPVIHKDFYFTARQIAVSRNSGMPLDTTTAELAGRKVAEEAEKLIIGNSAFNGYAYGGGTIYGITTLPERLTQVLTNPSETGWTPQETVQEILSMRQKSVDNSYHGSWVLYISTGWGQYIDDDYSTVKGDNTLRNRIAAIDGITDIRTLDYLTGYQMVLVQMTSDVIREVIGMDITTVQWAEDGGMTQNFKVMAIMVPQIRADIDGQTGIVHGNVA